MLWQHMEQIEIPGKSRGTWTFLNIHTLFVFGRCSCIKELQLFFPDVAIALSDCRLDHTRPLSASEPPATRDLRDARYQRHQRPHMFWIARAMLFQAKSHRNAPLGPISSSMIGQWSSKIRAHGLPLPWTVWGCPAESRIRS